MSWRDVVAAPALLVLFVVTAVFRISHALSLGAYKELFDWWVKHDG